MKQKLTQLEAIRGFAALYVVFHHTFSKSFKIGDVDLTFLFRFGQEAVILFFILSGFVIQYAYERGADKSFKLFFFKRFFRIYIPLAIVFITNYIFNLVINPELNSGAIGWNLVGNLLMLQDVSSLKPNVLCTPYLGNLPLWSLSYEWWFYMIFFGIATYFRKNTNNWVYVLSIVGALTYLIYPFFINRIFIYLLIWWSGAEMATLYLRKEDISFKNLRSLLCVMLVVTGILFFNAKVNVYPGLQKSIGVSPLLEVRHFAFSLIAIVVGIFWRKKNWIFFSSTIGLFEKFASISFGVYISHYFLVSNATYLSFVRNEYIEFLFYFAVCLFYAYLVERVIYVKLNKRIMNALK